ncbi:hypothetical protein N0V86_007559 [Didymella sp. IMI 355093]|nr:hypothetical protein N0V86_007559 [Didymella sp. IMI 355093]
MPDLFTRQTGTERALELLRPAGVLSFGPLTPANIEMLFRIAKLSPARFFYPHYLKEMQMISWDSNLPSMSQHGLFSICVRDIFDQARKEKVFYQNSCFAEPTKEQVNWLSSGSYFDNAVVKGTDAALEPFELRYDSQWLKSLSKILRSKWCKLHRLLADPAITYNAFDVMTWLSTMAFQESVNINAILALGSFFKRPEPTIQLPPTVSEFQMSQGDDFSSGVISSMVQSCTKGIGERAQRLNDLASKPIELAEEYRHRGHINWEPENFPETLLLEAESGILVRKEQEAIAGHMRDPEQGKNAVVQLVMGGGKSSTIVPIVAAHLADKQRLVRIVVGKPQGKQMLHTLISKLTGLLGRRIYQMPFSRDLRLSKEDADAIRAYCQDCIDNRGVMLIQPEHILSFKLMAIESSAIGKGDISVSLRDTQDFFDRVTRDIVDESDENFSPRFELVYTMGSQRSIKFSPDRWIIIQDILNLIPQIATQIKEELPVSIHLHHGGPGRFPRIRILRRDASERLSTLLAEHILAHGIAGLPVRSLSPALKQSIFRYITSLRLNSEEIDAVEGSGFWSETTMQPLFLLRGLIAGGMLAFAFASKRWRVNYGLDTTRVPPTKSAVPYKSKDTPSLRSEFSHPDVVIILTCLSYYYQSLSDEYLFEAFDHLLKSEQAAIQYNEWVAFASPDLPAPFRHLSGISIKDRITCTTKIFPPLRFSKGVIDYYLAHLCFKRELKEFPSKLSASGWDLGAEKAHPTMGFSGTNDTMHVLPLDVNQLDLSTQRHTNAEVLGHLLQKGTSIEQMLPVTDINASDAERLLQQIEGNREKPIRVLLDVGAQVLDRSNKEVAVLWLRMNQQEDVGAVVFFGEEELSVLDRAGRTESFQTSPFAKQLGQCLVYLDEAHTRGTDLKLPRDYRAAVTLGTALTKDRLAQACMRLRQLGKGQSVCFMVPEDIQMRILERNRKPEGSQIEVEDIICWSIGETWDDLRRSMPLWAVQGHRFERQKILMRNGVSTRAQAESILEDEAQTLEVRYRPRAEDASQFAGWDETNENIAKIITQCQNFQATSLSLAGLSEEQERELSPEIQQERQVERPPKLKPAKHALDPECWHPGSLKKAAFISDSYLRPIQFVVSVSDGGRAKKTKHLVLLSPYEANLLLPIIEKSKKATMHLFAPRHNSSFAPLDKLELWNVGKSFSTSSLTQDLKLQLHLFSGSLYFDSYEEYSHLCDALGLLRTTPTTEHQVSACGFITPPRGTWGLKKSPKTHLGKVLNTLLLKKSDFEQGPERLREISPEVVAEFEEHTSSRRSRPFDPEESESLFIHE